MSNEKLLIVKHQIREHAYLDDGEPFKISGDVAIELHNQVKKLIHKACVRAHSNNRRTIMRKDL